MSDYKWIRLGLLGICFLLAFGVWGWTHERWFHRVQFITSLPGQAERSPDAGNEAKKGVRDLIVPGRNEVSFHWIERVETMLQYRRWVVTAVNNENAPHGLRVASGFPNIYYLAGIAEFRRIVLKEPVAVAVERAALWADPICGGVVLLGLIGIVAFRLGLTVATALILFATTLFPFATLFLPGAPDYHGYGCIYAAISLVCMGLDARNSQAHLYKINPTRFTSGYSWSLVAGGFAALSLSTSAAIGGLVIAGTALGSIIAVVLRSGASDESSPKGKENIRWRCWAWGGAGLLLLIDGGAWWLGRSGNASVERNAFIWPMGWICVGEGLFWMEYILRRSNRPGRWRIVVVVATALIVAMAGYTRKDWIPFVFDREMYWFRLCVLPIRQMADGPQGGWLHGLGVSEQYGAALALVVLLPALAVLFSCRVGAAKKFPVLIALAAMALALLATRVQVGFWNVVDATLLALLVATVAASSSRLVSLLSAMAVLFSASVGALWLDRTISKTEAELAPVEAEQLLERDVAHWLAARSDSASAIIFAPPSTTTALSFFGGFAGIASFDIDNQASIQSVLRVAKATSVLEAQTILEAREVKYVILPSWDPFFKNYAQLSGQNRATDLSIGFVDSLERRMFPLWLRPVSYIVPRIGGSEEDAAVILERVPDQAPATAASRTVEYLLELGRVPDAQVAAADLRRFPADIAALTAMAEVAKAAQERAEFDARLTTIVQRLQSDTNNRLPLAWDRRVSLATVLVEGGKKDLARKQVALCLAQATEGRLRSLSPMALRNLLLLSRGFGIPFADAHLWEQAKQLLPPDVRTHFN